MTCAAGRWCACKKATPTARPATTRTRPGRPGAGWRRGTLAARGQPGRRLRRRRMRPTAGPGSDPERGSGVRRASPVWRRAAHAGGRRAGPGAGREPGGAGHRWRSNSPSWSQAALQRWGAERIAAGLDARDGLVQVRGWQQGTGLTGARTGPTACRDGPALAGFHRYRPRRPADRAEPGRQPPSWPARAGLKVIASGGVAGWEDIRAARPGRACAA